MSAERYTVRVGKDHLIFASGHFISFAGHQCEHLHGHNYRAAVEVEGPLYDSWPPPSHRRLFGNLPQKPAPIFNASKRVEVTSQDPEADAERILRGFAKRAFRRPFHLLVEPELPRSTRAVCFSASSAPKTESAEGADRG